MTSNYSKEDLTEVNELAATNSKLNRYRKVLQAQRRVEAHANYMSLIKKAAKEVRGVYKCSTACKKCFGRAFHLVTDGHGNYGWIPCSRAKKNEPEGG